MQGAEFVTFLIIIGAGLYFSFCPPTDDDDKGDRQ